METVRPEAWWRGARGEWYVVAQVALIALVFLGPRRWAGWPPEPLPWPVPLGIVGGALAFAGLALLVAGGVRLGGSLTALPKPAEDAKLVESGPFALARHPMYGGGVLLAFGWALLVRSPCTLAYAAVLFAFLDFKSRREERWLVERFADYVAYRRRVRRLIPFLY